MIIKALGHYKITSQICQGLIGEAYQAKDRILRPRLGIKILPGEFARDTDRMTRSRAKPGSSFH